MLFTISLTSFILFHASYRQVYLSYKKGCNSKYQNKQRHSCCLFIKEVGTMNECMLEVSIYFLISQKLYDAYFLHFIIYYDNI